MLYPSRIIHWFVRASLPENPEAKRGLMEVQAVNPDHPTFDEVLSGIRLVVPSEMGAFDRMEIRSASPYRYMVRIYRTYDSEYEGFSVDLS